MLPPNGGRFLQLPANSLFPGGAGPDCFSSENNSNYPWHLADTAWRTGYFGLLDGGFELGPLHRLGLQVFVSEKQAKAAFDALRGWLEPAAEGSSSTPFQNPDSDEAVDMTIRRLVMEREGHLPLNDGAKYVIERHPTRRRDEIRKRIAAITKPTRSGPVRPRNRAAKKI